MRYFVEIEDAKNGWLFTGQADDLGGLDDVIKKARDEIDSRNTDANAENAEAQ